MISRTIHKWFTGVIRFFVFMFSSVLLNYGRSRTDHWFNKNTSWNKFKFLRIQEEYNSFILRLQPHTETVIYSCSVKQRFWKLAQNSQTHLPWSPFVVQLLAASLRVSLRKLSRNTYRWLLLCYFTNVAAIISIEVTWSLVSRQLNSHWLWEALQKV